LRGLFRLHGNPEKNSGPLQKCKRPADPAGILEEIKKDNPKYTKNNHTIAPKSLFFAICGNQICVGIY
jgi:hypothetical protein